jgi:hypothetical protein
MKRISEVLVLYQLQSINKRIERILPLASLMIASVGEAAEEEEAE